MLFNSLTYAVFLPIVFGLYWILPHRFRWILLFVASYYFYMSWNVKYVGLILFTTLASYTAAILIEKREDPKSRKMILAVTAVLCLGVLFFFKYFNFLSTSVAAVLSAFAIPLHPVTLNLLLPVGISFYTFQTLSYVIDVYRGNVKAEHHFGYYATFISFFPQLVAGPIERTDNLLPQIKARHTFDYDRASYGMKLMAWGYFKKIVIADYLSQYVSMVYDAPRGFSGFALVLATLFFSIQIYCDFSGYSDIAVGSAKLLGIDLMANFRSPYFAESVKEFWGRWHISLSTWFRDYLYIPLGGNRVGKLRHNLNLMITFLASGLWHGANWTFVIWGGIHGVAQVIENLFRRKKKTEAPVPSGASELQVKKWLKRTAVFLFAAFTWIFFVSNSVSDAFYVIGNMFSGISAPAAYIREGMRSLDIGLAGMALKLALILILAVFDYFSLKEDVIDALGRKSLPVRWAVYIALGIVIVFLSKKGVAAEFVYFQF